mmetsp:Transcript_27503/g.79302  ORF Transcript_27503/g.79302 Transcript_27503/m.79302 type:complete len:391 (+) Transcript_27503:1070-2242(+)|eukprot:CAMPEP_0181031088 /NCGR_PEP_ID=MMETSP1070-20121207/6054_1 /TAXON_ID=265543 /ORGANISM="Minutocellus polymorphus, Strain NH13" /LENGTH=390 /DNA_ID=CAMNT_0023108459 /DNA_START=1796 /DNA_END=2968 /DNA_ORIENTATION=-
MTPISTVFTLISLLVSPVHGDRKLRRKRILFSDGLAADQRHRDLNVEQVGTLDPDEDWDGIFFDASAMSLSMPDKPKPPASLGDIYKPVTRTILNKHCRSEYGSTGLAVPDEDGVDYYCRVTDDVLDEDALYAISIAAVCNDEYGSSYDDVLLGGNSDAWACVDWAGDGASYIVVPVLVIADDYTTESDGNIDDAISSVTAAMERVQSWYRHKMKSGRTFRVSRPILKMSDKSAQEWNELSCLTASPADRPQECIDQSSESDRFGYFYEAQAEAMQTSLPQWPLKQLVVIFTYSGPDSAPFWLGAAAAGPYSANPPNIAVCPEESDTCGLYSIGHEIGHSFGLSHNCEIVKKPKCYEGIMQNPGDAGVLNSILFRKEQEVLDASPFFGLV